MMLAGIAAGGALTFVIVLLWRLFTRVRERRELLDVERRVREHEARVAAEKEKRRQDALMAGHHPAVVNALENAPNLFAQARIAEAARLAAICPSTRDGVRCAEPRGHAGPHVGHVLHTGSPELGLVRVTWADDPESVR